MVVGTSEPASRNADVCGAMPSETADCRPIRWARPVAGDDGCCQASDVPSFVTPVIAPGSLSRVHQPVLTAGSIRLRPWADADAPALVSAYQEPTIQRWHARSLTPDEADDWVASAHAAWMAETAVSWAVDLDDQLAGRMTLKLDNSDGSAAAAYWTRTVARRRGVASRALRLATGWAFSAGMHRVELEHSTLNPVSCLVADRAGFDAEGTRRGSALHADGWHDMHVHATIDAMSTLGAPQAMACT
ncbi:GNAT family N-acetyltransferase [Brachybacterium alimentarium]|uniref:GNAT family N-acetyltransferase n=2 Tax=Brachybacterium alimentarium TaxID=47845 RepID=UPI0030B81F14